MADRQTCSLLGFLLKLKALGTLDRRAHHLSYQGDPKSPLHIFFVLTNLDCFDLGTSLKKLCFKPSSDIAYIGNWPRAIYLFDRQTGLICLIGLVVKLLTGFEAFGPPVKEFAIGVSVIILDEASVFQLFKCVLCTVQCAVY